MNHIHRAERDKPKDTEQPFLPFLLPLLSLHYFTAKEEDDGFILGASKQTNVLGCHFQPHSEAQGSGFTGTPPALSPASHVCSRAEHKHNGVLAPCTAALEFLRTVYWLANLKLNLKPCLNTQWHVYF